MPNFATHTHAHDTTSNSNPRQTVNPSEIQIDSNLITFDLEWKNNEKIKPKRHDVSLYVKFTVVVSARDNNNK